MIPVSLSYVYISRVDCFYYSQTHLERVLLTSIFEEARLSADDGLVHIVIGILAGNDKIGQLSVVQKTTKNS